MKKNDPSIPKKGEGILGRDKVKETENRMKRKYPLENKIPNNSSQKRRDI